MIDKATWLAARARREYHYWFGAPLEQVKQEMVIRYGRFYRARTLVETGTSLGGTVAVCLPYFDRIYSIELDDELYERAAAAFADQPQVTIIHGDSAAEIPALLERLPSSRTLFWLDAHFSGAGTARGAIDPPLLPELEAILAMRDAKDVILIDDAGSFPNEVAHAQRLMREHGMRARLRQLVLRGTPRRPLLTTSRFAIR